MRRARVLLAIPDRSTRAAVARLVAGILPAEIHEVATGVDALDRSLALLPDLAILNGELPGFDGLQVCHRLRGVAQLQETPVVILGPRGDQPRKYQAFYVGATEYVELPYDPTEFECRLRVQLRGLLRDREASAQPIAAGGLAIEPATRTVRWGDRTAVLTPAEFALVRYLAGRPNRPASAEQLLSEALGHPPRLGNPQIVHTHVRNLRKKLEADPAHPVLLQRHPAGYLLVP